MHSRKFVAALLSAGLLVASLQALATPLANIDGIGTETGSIFVAFVEQSSVISMKHDAAAGRSTYLQRGVWNYYHQSDDPSGPPGFAGFDGIFAWTAGIDPDGQVTDSGSMLFIGDLGAGDEILFGGQLRMVGLSGQGPGETEGTNSFWGLQYLFNFDFLDSRLSAMGTGFRFNFPVFVESVFDTPFYDDFEIDTDSFYSDPELIGLVPEPSTLALLGLGLAGLGLSRRRKAA